MDKKKTWFYTSIGAIALSVLSLLLPVITYHSAKTGMTTRYNIIRMFNTRYLIKTVFSEYHGSFLRSMSNSGVAVAVIVLCVVGIAAIVLAFIGINSMTKQYESDMPFRLAICGLIGTAIPSVVLLMLYLVSKNQFRGTMHLGAYIFITPLAMVLACLTVTSRHRLSREEARIQAEARAYIRPAGDLPAVSRYGEE